MNIRWILLYLEILLVLLNSLSHSSQEFTILLKSQFDSFLLFITEMVRREPHYIPNQKAYKGITLITSHPFLCHSLHCFSPLLSISPNSSFSNSSLAFNYDQNFFLFYNYLTTKIISYNST